MAKPISTAEYVAALSAEQRAGLEKIRKAIVSAAPKAAPSFSYRMPAFTYKDRPLIWYAAWKRHYSLYPLSDGMRAAFASEIEDYDTEKGTIKFPANEAIPVALIKKLVKQRIAELEALWKSRETGA